MIGTRPEDLLRHLRQDVPDDAELVRRFRGGDREAFEDLVRRHGPLVLAVCFQIVGHRQDAEDAFQATFLTLARKAEFIRDPQLLCNWLYGAALRIARRAKRGAARRRTREVQAVNAPEPAARADATPFEHEAAIHNEIERLPEFLRDAVVLCELRGASRSEAAAMLRIPEGTLSSRLAAGRKKLAERLERRGIVPGAALVSLAAVPESLVAAVCRIASGAAIPANIERLMRGGFPMRSASIVVLGLSLSVVAAVYAGQPEESAPPVPAQPLAIAAEPKADAPPATKVEYSAKPRLQKTMDVSHHATKLVWSPNGTWFVMASNTSIVFLNPNTSTRGELSLRPAHRFVGVTPDSKHVITDLRESGLLSGLHAVRLWYIASDRGGGPMGGGLGGLSGVSRSVLFEQAKEHALDPESTQQYGFPTGGERIRTMLAAQAKTGVLNRVEVFDSKLGDAESKSVFAADTEYESLVLSPSGGRVALLNKMSLTVHDIAAKKESVFVKLPEANPPLKEKDGRKRTAAFSPDESKLITALVGRSPVILSMTGDKPVILEGVESLSMYVHEASFSPNNRLVAMHGVRYGKRPPLPPGIGGPKEPADGPIGLVLIVWDAQTGKIVKTWEPFDVIAAFHPLKPTLAILEANGSGTRIGFWDFSAESGEKK